MHRIFLVRSWKSTTRAREQPNGGLHLVGVRAFVRSWSHVKVFAASLFGIFRNFASFTAINSMGLIRISAGTKQGRNSHWTKKVLGLERPGVHGGARAGIALLPTSRGPRSRATLAFLWGRGAGGFARQTQTAPASACPTTRPLGPLRLTEEAGKWPDQSGQSRLFRTARAGLERFGLVHEHKNT